MRYSVKTEIPDRCLENELNAFVEQGYEVVNVFQTVTAIDSLLAHTYCVVARKASESVPGCMGGPSRVAASERVSFSENGIDTHKCYDPRGSTFTIPISGRYQWIDKRGLRYDAWYDAGYKLFNVAEVNKI